MQNKEQTKEKPVGVNAGENKEEAWAFRASTTQPGQK